MKRVFSNQLKLKKIPPFPIQLTWYIEQLTQLNILGSHENYIVNANGVEIARFLDEVSAQEYIKFLQQSNFRPLMSSPQGNKLIEVLYELYCKEKLTKIDTDKKGIVINSLIDRKFQA